MSTSRSASSVVQQQQQAYKAASSGSKPFEEDVQQCIAHLQTHSAHYYEIVRGKKQDGVLWAVFTTPSLPAGAQRPASHRVAVKRASFLPITTVLNTNAPSLIQMFTSCDHTRQFVCWFTVESPEGQPLVSKVMIVDAVSSIGAPYPTQQQQEQHHSVQRHNQAAADSTPSPRPRGASGAISDLKAEMAEFEQQRRAQLGVHGFGGGPTGPVATHGNGNESTNGSAAASRQASPTVGRRGVSPGPSSSGANQRAASDAQAYQHVLRVSMQVADSVSDMGAALEELRGVVNKLRDDAEAAPKGPTHETVNAILHRLDAMERRQIKLEERVNGFDEIQTRYFEQMEALRKELARPDSYGNSRLHDQRMAEERIDRKLHEPISYARVAEERAKREMAAAAGVSLRREPGRPPHQSDSVSQQIAGDAGMMPVMSSEGDDSDVEPTPYTTAPPPTAHSQRPQVKTPLAAASSSVANTAAAAGGSYARSREASASPSSSVGGRNNNNPTNMALPNAHSDAGQSQNTAAPSPLTRRKSIIELPPKPAQAEGESLSDMIKTMERKLSRIALPAKTPNKASV